MIWASVSAPARVDAGARSHAPAQAAVGRRLYGDHLGGDGLSDDLTVSHMVGVGVHQAGDHGLTEADTGLHAHDFSVRGHGVGREQDPGCLREDHLLDDDGHVDQAVIEAVLQPVGHGPLGEQRGPALLHTLDDGRRSHHVQVRVLLAGEGSRRQILRSRAGTDGVGRVLAEPGDRTGDCRP